MFEDKNRTRKRKYFILTVFLLLVAVGFGVGYYLNSGSGLNVEGDKAKESPTTQLKIPESLKNPTVKPTTPSVEFEEEAAGQTAVTDVSVVKEDTKFIFRRHFTLCGHDLDNTVKSSPEEVNMNKEALQAKYPDWTIGIYSPSEVVFTKELTAICPKHFLIGIDNGCIAIFVYDEEGKKILKERTDITTNNLPPEDQKSLESGIIADNEDDLSQKLEGFSN